MSKSLSERLKEEASSLFREYNFPPAVAIYYGENFVEGMEDFLRECPYFDIEILQRASMLELFQELNPMTVIDESGRLGFKSKSEGKHYLKDAVNEAFNSIFKSEKQVRSTLNAQEMIIGEYKRIAWTLIEAIQDVYNVPPEAIRFYRLRPKDPSVN